MLFINIGFILCYLALLAPQAHSKPVNAINSQLSEAPICSLHANEVLKIIATQHSMNVRGMDDSFREFADSFISQDADLHGLKSKDFWFLSAADKSAKKTTELVDNVNTKDSRTRDRVVEGNNQNFGADENDENLNDDDDENNESNLTDGDDVNDDPEAVMAFLKFLGSMFGIKELSSKDEPDSMNEARLRRRLNDQEEGEYNYKLCKSEPTVERRFDKFPFIKINWSCKKNSRLIRNLDFDCVPIYETRPVLKIAEGCLSFDSRSEEVWEYSTETVATGCQALLKFSKPSS